MRKIVFIIMYFASNVLLMAKGIASDTCNYNFVENGAIVNINKFINLEEIIESNKTKGFYLAMIRIYDDVYKKKRIIIKDCSSINEGELVLFDGEVIDLNYKNIIVDASALFKYIGSKTRVTFSASECGKGFHSDLKVLIFKIYDKCFVGYSSDGSDLMDAFKKIVGKYFIIPDDETKNKFLSLLKDSPKLE